VITGAQVTRLLGDPALEAVEITDVKSKQTRIVKAQAVIAALGFVADLGPLTEWGLRIRDRHIPVDTTMATNLPRVFAAGDVTDYPGKVRLISVGFGEAATAVNNAAVLIDPTLELFPGHSTDQPKEAIR
jgi:thioredoxin reductase (NADPH)